MKIHLYTLGFILMSSLSIHAQQKNAHSSSPVNSSWQQRASAWIQEEQSAVHPIGNGRFAAVNAGSSLAFQISSNGYKTRPLKEQSNNWLASFTLVRLNAKAWHSNPGKTTTYAKGRELRFDDPALSIQYLNEEKGLRQNFIINKKDPRAMQLTVSLKVETKLMRKLTSVGALTLKDESGKTQFFYDGLEVWDANHKRLPAKMELEGDELRIVVNDASAVYPVTIDPLNHAAMWNDNGNGLIFPLLNDLSAHVLYGFSVSDAGDVNGDGFGDVIVGAPAYVDIVNVSNGTFNTVSVGAAFLYYGNTNGPSDTPDEVLQPTTQVGALFGYSVSKAGDVNGDGFDDVVVGAPGDRITLNIGAFPSVATSVAVGKVYVYYGGAGGTFDGNINTTPTVSATISLQASDFGTLLSVPANPLYGYSVTNAGDVNGDGKADILVGSPGFVRLLPTPLVGGRVDVYHGSASGISTTPARTIIGTQVNGLFGFSVSTAGNVNGDLNGGRAISDIIVGAPGNLNLLAAGQAFIFHGSTSGITATSAASANRILTSSSLTSLFGFSVSNAGDVNNDGYGDVVIGEPAALENLLTQTASIGSAKVYYGSASGVNSSGATTLTSPRSPSILGILQGNLLFGFSVSTGGDLNCDGYSDLVIGEPGGTALSLGTGLLNLVSTNVVSGQAYIYFGQPTGVGSTPQINIGETDAVSVANLIGYSVSNAGDFNGDGKADLLVGAPNGTVNLGGSILPAIGNALNIVNVNSIGSAYGWAGCNSQTALPVTYRSFDAKKQGSKGLLNWSVSTDEKINYYVVERSTNQKEFEKIGSVLAKGGSGDASYSFVDENPSPVNYYRIRSVDFDHVEAYSKIVKLMFETDGRNVVTVLPNPVKEQYALQLNNFSTGSYRLQVYDAQGMLMQQKPVMVSGGQQSVSMSRQGLSSGSYVVRLISGDGATVATTRIICN